MNTVFYLQVFMRCYTYNFVRVVLKKNKNIIVQRHIYCISLLICGYKCYFIKKSVYYYIYKYIRVVRKKFEALFFSFSLTIGIKILHINFGLYCMRLRCV